MHERSRDDEDSAMDPHVPPELADAERRLLAQLAGRRKLAARVIGRQFLAPRAARGLVRATQIRPRLSLPRAWLQGVRFVAPTRRATPAAEIERFWWRRMRPHQAMLRRYRPRGPLA